MTITTLPARNEYTATAGQTVFNYTFKIYQSSELQVFVTPAGQVANDTTDEVSGFSVTGVGNENGGTITLATGASVNDLVTIVSDIPYNRQTNYQNNGDFIPSTVNSDIDRTVSLVKQSEDLLNRTLVGQKSAQNSEPFSLPAPEAKKFLRWKNDLSGIENTNIIDIGSTLVTGAATTIIDSDLATNRSVISNGSGKIAVSTTTATEVGYLTGASSNIQNQIDSKQDTITGAATSVISANLVALRVLASDAYGKIQVATATVDEVNRLSGVTSGVQNQIDDRSMILLSTIDVVSGDTNVEFASGIDSTYYEYQIHMQYVTPLTDAVHMALKMSSDGGATYYTGASDNQYAFVGHNAVGGAQGGGTANSTEIQLTATGNIGNAANEVGVSGVLKLFYPSRAAYTNCHWNLNYNATDGTVSVVEGTGQVKVSASINAIIFQFSAGNFGYGKFQLYGINRT